MWASREVADYCKRQLIERDVAGRWGIDPSAIDFGELTEEIQKHLLACCLKMFKPKKTKAGQEEFTKGYGVDPATVDFDKISKDHIVAFCKKQLIESDFIGTCEEDEKVILYKELCVGNQRCLPSLQTANIQGIFDNFIQDYPLVSQMQTNKTCQSELFVYLEKAAQFESRDLPSVYSSSDLATITYIKILEKLDKYHFRAKFNTWCAAVMGNTKKDLLRKAERASQRELSLDSPVSFDADNDTSRHEIIPSDRPGPETIICDMKVVANRSEELLKMIDAALEKSTNRERDLYILTRKLAGVKSKEVAAEMGVTAGSVDNLKHRLTERMKAFGVGIRERVPGSN